MPEFLNEIVNLSQIKCFWNGSYTIKNENQAAFVLIADIYLKIGLHLSIGPQCDILRKLTNEN